MKLFWDRISGLYDIFQLTNRSVYKQLAAALKNDIPKGAKLLDCAAGTGFVSVTAASAASHVRCTDFSKDMLIQCMKKAKRNGIRNISFARRDIYRLKDKDNTYDVTAAANVLHLLDDPEAAIKELIRVTKPGGKIILPTFLAGEAGLYGLLLNVYKIIGFSPKKAYDMNSYMKLITDSAESCGCREYSTRMFFGPLPMGYSVITKNSE